MPISLEPGTVRSPEFMPNINTLYDISIEAKTRGKLPAKVVECLLSAQKTLRKTAPSLPSCGWDGSTSRDQVLEHGFTEDKYCFGSRYSDGATARSIGHFHAEKGGRCYVLSINVLDDGTALELADSHLIVDSSDFSESGGVLLTVLLFPCGASAITGLSPMISSSFAKRRQDRGTS